MGGREIQRCGKCIDNMHFLLGDVHKFGKVCCPCSLVLALALTLPLQVFGVCYPVKDYKRYAEAVEYANTGHELATYCHRFSPFGKVKHNRNTALKLRGGNHTRELDLGYNESGISKIRSKKWYVRLMRKKKFRDKKKKEYGMFGTICSAASEDHLSFTFIRPRKRPRKKLYRSKMGQMAKYGTRS